MKRSSKMLFCIPAALLLLSSACGPSTTAIPAPTADINAIYTQAAATISSEMTQEALSQPTATLTPVPPTLTPEPTATIQPVPTLAPPTQAVLVYPTVSGPTAIPVNTATANGCYNAALVSDVTVPPGAGFSVGDTFTKTWRVKNTGTCEWNGNFKIAYVSGDTFGSDTTKIRQTVGVGAVADISLDMTAPNLAGSVNSNWQLVTEDGKYFGQVLTVSIILPGASNGTSTATPVSSACYNAALVSASVADGTKLDPNESFTLTWVIKNTGSCEWNGNFKINFISGDMLGSDTTKIRQNVSPGSSAEISLDMVAPGSSGSVTSSWQLATDDGTLFGPTFVIKITVK